MSFSLPKGNAESLRHFKIQVNQIIDSQIVWREMIEKCEASLSKGDFVGKRNIILEYLLARLSESPVIEFTSREWIQMTKDLFDKGVISMETIKESDNLSGHNLVGDGTIVLYTIETRQFLCTKRSFKWTDWTVQIQHAVIASSMQ